MLSTRIWTAFFGIIISLAVIFSPAVFVNISIFAVALICIFEVLLTLKVSKKLCVLSGIVCAVICFRNICSFLPDSFEYIFLLLCFCTIILDYKNIKIQDLTLTFCITLYVAWSLEYVILIRHMEFGQSYIFIVFLGAWFSDTGAYFAGIHFGKHKLCPDISPKKTIEGAIGGILTSILSLLIFGFVIKLLKLYEVNYLKLVIIGLITGITAIVGDLSASVIKRNYKIKDFGNILPGHGGLLDRFDSVIFTAPFVYWLINWIL